MKNNLQGINSTVDEAKKQKSNLEYNKGKKNPIRITKRKCNPKKWGLCKEHLGQLQSYQCSHHGVQEGKEYEQEIENLIEKIMTENFPNLMKQRDVRVLEAQRIPNKLNPKRHTLRHIIIKIQNIKNKERILKAARQQQLLTFKGAPIRLSTDFLTKTL